MILVGSKVVSADGYPITVEQAFKRYLTFRFCRSSALESVI